LVFNYYMHKLNVYVLGSTSFVSTINELKQYLKFNLLSTEGDTSKNSLKDCDVLIFNDEGDESELDNILANNSCVKILATSKNQISRLNFDNLINLPTSVKEINKIVEISASKRNFLKNSSIKIKEYYLDKNEKKLVRKNLHVILTEKEIELLELFLNESGPISKNKILSAVWRYSSDADTHTVETHIYRLRKKINDKFLDKNFILNDKAGYYI